MKVEIKRIYKSQEIKEGLISYGNFQVFFPDIKLSVLGIGFTITKDGKLHVKPPRRSFNFKDENGNEKMCQLPIIKFENNEKVWEEVKKALRRDLVSDMTSKKDGEG